MKNLDHFYLFVSGSSFNGFLWDIGRNNISGAFINLMISATLLLIFIKTIRGHKKKTLSIGDIVHYSYESDDLNPYTVVGIRLGTVEIMRYEESGNNIILMRMWVPCVNVSRWENRPKPPKSPVKETLN